LGWTLDVSFRKSPIHGTGVFAKSLIPAGTRIWEYDDTMIASDAASLARLDAGLIRFALHGGYLHKPSDRLLWYTDGMQYMNHAESPRANVGLGRWPALTEDHTIALRDIAPGEELFEDYCFWAEDGVDPGHWLHPFYLRYCPEHLVFLDRLRRVRRAA
jgi:hypothetical protein